jgi:hypothetical protein
MASYDPGLELDEATYARSNAVIEKAMRHGEHRTRAELGAALTATGIGGDLRRTAHIVMRAELEGIICSGALRGKQHTYALLAERAPHARTLPRDEALAELTRRYFTSHGPALPQDFAWWSGLTVADARAGIDMNKQHLVSETMDGKVYWFAPSAEAPKPNGPNAHLLPNYDEYLIAYRDRGAFFHPALLNSGPKSLRGVLRRHIIVVDGYVIGGWYQTTTRDETTLNATLLAQPGKRGLYAIESAATEYGRFLGKAVTLKLTANS